MTTETQNLMTGLLDEIIRVTEIKQIYLTIPAGTFAATLMELSIQKAKEAIKNDDTIAMIQAYEELKGYEL